MIAPQPVGYTSQFEALLASERARLVRLCVHLVRDADVAEDVAQETLIEAWRHQHELTDAQGMKPWLSAIARNMCLRWLRRKGREQARLGHSTVGTGDPPVNLGDSIQDPFDFEIELERDELAALLDRALALLPPETRIVLVQRYIEELSHAEIAARLGLSENAVAVRLHRGKLAFRRVLAKDLREDAAPYNLMDDATDSWQETRMWCPLCGQRCLLGRMATPVQHFELQCPHCCVAPGGMSIHSGLMEFDLFAGIKGFRAAYSRLSVWRHEYHSHAVRDGAAPCTKCGRMVMVHRRLPETVPPQHRNIRGIYAECTNCGAVSYSSLNGLILNLPEFKPFWRKHPRMQVLPEREIEVAGGPVLLKRCESLDGRTWLDVLVERDTLAVIGMHDGIEQTKGMA